ncbi:hypothetical protein LSH36_143g01023 [Paralvinella palmiformis]|uniref:SUEL-type lectin domain-containing protein n=1 Tax=Paralvinella palmiformis TaxID=53620 RepID=A0AAD9JVD7_9ANNE|nr:hypothetical protein LSH36_143g01023 [Paralvinella palmiformis]
MTHALYGRMRLGRCVRKDLGYVGCYTNALNELDFLCSGRQKCEVRIPYLGTILELRLACLEELKNYLEAAFKCVKVVTPKQKSCLSSQPILIKQSSGYIASTTTFKTACGSHSAPWLIRAERGQRINITLHDYTRGYHTLGDNREIHKATSCHAYAVAKEQNHREAVTVCGGGSRIRHVLTTIANQLEIRVLQGTNSRRSYFLLEFQIIGCTDPSLAPEYTFQRLRDQVRVSCEATGETWILTCDSSQWTGVIGNCSSTGLHDDDEYGFRLVMGSISMSTEVSIVVVLAVACVIGLCILLTGLCYVRRRAYHRHGNRSAGDYAAAGGHYETQVQGHSEDAYKVQDGYCRTENMFTGNDYACIVSNQCGERVTMTSACTCDVASRAGYGSRAITWPANAQHRCMECSSQFDDPDSSSSCRSDDPIHLDQLEKTCYACDPDLDVTKFTMKL